jgi:hypothetical protein
VSEYLDDLRVYSPEPWTFARTHVYDPAGRRSKPDGLWVSVGDDWERWCRSESYGWPEHHRHITTVTLAPDANILVISDPEALRAFTRDHTIDRWYNVNWLPTVAAYDGIVIAPYLWECRLEQGVSWYYTWDCASGCIWSLSAVASVEHRVNDTAAVVA